MEESKDDERHLAMLSALAQPDRLAAFRALVAAGSDGIAAGSLARTLELAPSSLSFHLTHLQRSGLAHRRRIGRSIIYSADFGAMRALLDYLTENCCGGADCSTDERGAA